MPEVILLYLLHVSTNKITIKIKTPQVSLPRTCILSMLFWFPWFVITKTLYGWGLAHQEISQVQAQQKCATDNLEHHNAGGVAENTAP